jgi:hypothetical protein
MLFVTATTLTAGTEMVSKRFPAMIQSGQVLRGVLCMALTIFVIACVMTLLVLAVSRWLVVLKLANSGSSKIEDRRSRIEDRGS